jgi:hypothetical protein
MNIRQRRKLIGLLKSKLGHAGLWVAVLGQVQAQSEFLTKNLSPAQVGWLLFVVGVLVVGLRWYTSQPLEDKAKK